jgi:hypothetical protein
VLPPVPLPDAEPPVAVPAEVPAVPAPPPPVVAVPLAPSPLPVSLPPPQAAARADKAADETLRIRKSLRLKEREDMFGMFLLRGQAAQKAITEKWRSEAAASPQQTISE